MNKKLQVCNICKSINNVAQIGEVEMLCDDCISEYVNKIIYEVRKGHENKLHKKTISKRTKKSI